MQDNITIIVPTFNRPELLARTLSSLQDQATFPIVVADGSNTAEVAERNRSTCQNQGPHVQYFHLPTAQTQSERKIYSNFLQRYLAAIERVQTPYVITVADDDLLIAETALKSAAFLDDHKDYVACHGIYLSFRDIEDGIEIDSVHYDGPSIDGGEFGSRLIQLLSKYEAPFYAVFRKSALAEIVGELATLEFGLEFGHLFVEVYHSARCVAAGKIKRLPDIFNLRNIGVPPHPRSVSGWQQMIAENSNGFLAAYQTYRSNLTKAVAPATSTVNTQNLAQAVDISFLIYLASQCSMGYWVSKYLEIAVNDADERENLRNVLTGRLMSGRSTLGVVRRAIAGRIDRIIGRAFGRNSLAPADRNRGQQPVRYADGVWINPAIENKFSKIEWRPVIRKWRSGK